MTNGLPHRFATVLSADVANYASLMESGEERTVFGLKQCRSHFTNIINANHGREFGTFGDSLMAEFASPVEALRAARSIQDDNESRKRGERDEDQLQLRIGLHAGDVLYEEEDLFGDVVNTASRIQQLARPGGIAVSEFVFDQVIREPGFEFHKLGRQHLKNIASPIVVFDVAWRNGGPNFHRLSLLAGRYSPAIIGIAGMLLLCAGLILYVEYRVARIGPVIHVPIPEQAVVLRDDNVAGPAAATAVGRHAIATKFAAQSAMVGQRAAGTGCLSAHSLTVLIETANEVGATPEPIAESRPPANSQ